MWGKASRRVRQAAAERVRRRSELKDWSQRQLTTGDARVAGRPMTYSEGGPAMRRDLAVDLGGDPAVEPEQSAIDGLTAARCSLDLT